MEDFGQNRLKTLPVKGQKGFQSKSMLSSNERNTNCHDDETSAQASKAI